MEVVKKFAVGDVYNGFLPNSKFPFVIQRYGGYYEENGDYI